MLIVCPRVRDVEPGRRLPPSIPVCTVSPDARGTFIVLLCVAVCEMVCALVCDRVCVTLCVCYCVRDRVRVVMYAAVCDRVRPVGAVFIMGSSLLSFTLSPDCPPPQIQACKPWPREALVPPALHRCHCHCHRIHRIGCGTLRNSVAR